MKSDIDHLPQAKQRELERAVEILHAEFADAMKHASSQKKKDGRILKIILFGSYARGNWVDEPHTAKGYQSDFDLLIVVNHERVVDFSTYWYRAEDRLMHEPTIKRPVNFIVHTLSDVNNALAQGQYFFSDVIEEGIALYELKGEKPFVTPQPPSPEAALEVAKEHHEFWMKNADDYFRQYTHAVNDGAANVAAFDLHQAVERYYTALLLVQTNYSPASHNIKFLRSLAEDQDPRLIDVWPRETKADRRAFELLKRAYVEARYSKHYKITADELAWLGERAEALRDMVAAICVERIDALANQTA
ncbi:HEPN domain-containing protein [Parasphingopyxis algicola]|uniref:nucleotidyltransferase and HEPN domain-containing protein n=1 Tax=Parasphingopyxis algicola TaxID=2026624 RepID=UPI00159FED6F|nr:nucleotidyltransferase and HEPN domain-containing protein [Parasphingopyxis algicola]QLC25046.1 HEPN domain-containing protein [Parasphingopyxis algicola]